MPKLPLPPAEPPRITSLDGLAPAFRATILKVIAGMRARGRTIVVRESLRTEARQAYLYNFGRVWDDDRGIVTQIAHADLDWHFFGVAVDFTDEHGDDGPSAAFAADLEEVAEFYGLTSGRDWAHDAPAAGAEGATTHFCDNPHVQFYCVEMHVAPSDNARALFASGGLPAVWSALGAI